MTDNVFEDCQPLFLLSRSLSKVKVGVSEVASYQPHIGSFLPYMATLPYGQDKPLDTKKSQEIDDRKAALAEFCLEHMGRPPPPASFFRSLIDKPTPPSTLQNVQERMQREKETHLQDLASIYDFQAQQRHALHREHRAAMDGGDYYPNHSYGERRPTLHDKQEPVPLPPELWFALMSEHQQSAEFDDMISHFNSTFFHTQRPLYRQVEVLQKQQKVLEERRNSTLPTSLAEFNLITSRDYQVRIAKALATRGPPPMGEHDTPHSAQALLVAYESDDAFKARVQEVIASTKSKDPRSRPSAGQTQ
ncbi:hypothetical protein CPB86DRAFT_43448 [Serendipita vermifera]|nr:hypothetical protein CPB86DRAFT_43448 [Serendipita vermifera]